MIERTGSTTLIPYRSLSTRVVAWARSMPSRGDSDPLVTEVDPTVGPPQPGSTLAQDAQVYLVCRQDARLDVVPLAEGSELVVGRTEGEIRVDSPRVSRRHAVFALRGGTLTVEDLGSRNGTRAGPAVLRSERRPLAGGDVIAIGPLVIVVARTDRDLAWSPPREARRSSSQTRRCKRSTRWWRGFP